MSTIYPWVVSLCLFLVYGRFVLAYEYDDCVRHMVEVAEAQNILLTDDDLSIICNSDYDYAEEEEEYLDDDEIGLFEFKRSERATTKPRTTTANGKKSSTKVTASLLTTKPVTKRPVTTPNAKPTKKHPSKTSTPKPGKDKTKAPKQNEAEKLKSSVTTKPNNTANKLTPTKPSKPTSKPKTTTKPNTNKKTAAPLSTKTKAKPNIIL